MNAGVVENGKWSETVEGTPQGASVSPLLANVYLHYVFDLWADRWRRREADGEVIIVRYADDYIVGFEDRDDDERFLAELRDRLARFCLELAGEKTRLIEFGRYAARTSTGTGTRQATNVRFPGLHSHLWERQEGTVRAQAPHVPQAAAGEATSDQG
jgi:RNA-directed DNA polymerase